MLTRAKTATAAVESAAVSVNDLATDARAVLSDVKQQVTTGATILPVAVAAIGIVAIVALIVSLVAVSRD